ncbi:MAG: hypothetical protein ACRDBQ_22160 [Shewanella sp.]
MKKYLRMSDVFKMQAIRLPASWSYEMIAHAVHAIDSHDELVEMNKELLAVIERVIGSSNEFAKIMGTSEWADGYKQCSIDTGEALRGMLDNIKAKAAS